MNPKMQWVFPEPSSLITYFYFEYIALFAETKKLTSYTCTLYGFTLLSPMSFGQIVH